MHLILDLLEIFLPELAGAMSGPASMSVRRRLLRVGLAFFAVAAIYIAARLVWAVVLNREAISPDIFSLSEKVSLAVFFVSGVVYVLLSRVGKATVDVSQTAPGLPSGLHDVDQTVDQEWRPEIRLAATFDATKAGHFYLKSRFPWRRFREVLRGGHPVEEWQIEVQGVSLVLGLYLGAEYLRIREQGGTDEARFALAQGTKPGLILRLVDAAGETRDLDIVPQKSLRQELLVFVDGVPLPLSRG